MTKRILITGKNSYIGNSLAAWLSRWPDQYETDQLSLRDNSWENSDFSVYDAVFHVAGIAHQTKASAELHRQINRDLSIAVAEKAKREGVRHFVFMSTMAVYGMKDSMQGVNEITEATAPQPTSHYGRSKYAAECSLLDLCDKGQGASLGTDTDPDADSASVAGLNSGSCASMGAGTGSSASSGSGASLDSGISASLGAGSCASLDSGTSTSLDSGTGASLGAGSGASMGAGTGASLGTGSGASFGVGSGSVTDTGRNLSAKSADFADLDAGFTVCIVRAPMVYGPNCPGNYSHLRRLALRSGLLPRVDNQRSVLFIDHLCECLRLLLDSTHGGIVCPRDSDDFCTSDVMGWIAETAGRSPYKSHFLGACIPPLAVLFPVLAKAFGNLSYARDLYGIPCSWYNTLTLREAVQATETGWH